MSGRCPFCGSTDLADLVKSPKVICLDCEKTWLPKQRARSAGTKSR